jgi:predicted MFS family arabinose efflux permease
METLIVNPETKAGAKSATLVLLFIICFISSAFGGAVSTLMSVYLPVVVKDLQGNVKPGEINAVSGYINAIFIFGWALGGFGWGVISDKIGRKKALLLAIGCYGIFTILTGTMPTWWGIVICRFLSGFGVGGVLVVTVTLLSEEWPARTRSVVIGIVSIAFPIGIFSAGVINNFNLAWREGFLIGIIPLALAIFGTWLLKESDKWLTHKAENTLSGNAVKKLFSENDGRGLLLGSLTFGTMLIGLWAIFSWMPTWIQSIIATSDAYKERGLSMMVLGMGGLTGGFLSGWVTNFIGLRKSMIVCFSVCAVMSFVLFKTNTVFNPIIYGEIAVLALFFGVSQGVLSVYIPHLFSTGIRATATGFCFNIGRIFTATAVLFVGILVNTLGGYGNALFIFSSVFTIGLLVVLLIKDGTTVSKDN